MSRKCLKAVTYNIHDAVGRDRRYDPERIVSILQDINADIFALQEVTLDHAGDLLRLFRTTGMQVIDGTVFERGRGRYGNLVLVQQHAVTATAVHDLAYHGREPRNALEVQLNIEAESFSLLATHLGLRKRERSAQIGRLTRIVSAHTHIKLMMGDLNIWSGQTLRPLLATGFVYQAVRSFPTWPGALAALDRIMVRKPLTIQRCYRYESALARVASDHYPVIAELEFSAE